MTNKNPRIGFVSTRFAGTDGVSLEVEKWAYVLERMGCPCFYFAGVCDRPAEVSFIVPEAFFHTPEMNELNSITFSRAIRPPEITHRFDELKKYLKSQLQIFLKKFDIEVMVVENALAIPIHIPLGLALTELIAEIGISVIAHHHDMFWERKRFLVNCVWDYLNMSFPPHLPSIRHVVINSSASNQLALRTGISSMLIPNVMDFNNPPPECCDDYNTSARHDLGVFPGQLLILQPTRVIPRKGIEHAIELLSRLDMDASLVISHASGDEGLEYERRIRDYSHRMGVRTLFISEIIQQNRGLTPDGKKIYRLSDIYPQADLVTYPSDLEGFGNAFLETIYYKRPLVVNNYTIYSIDIKPVGFRTIEFDGFITEETVSKARRWLTDKREVQEIVDANYEIGRRFYSYEVLQQRLEVLLAGFPV